MQEIQIIWSADRAERAVSAHFLAINCLYFDVIFVIQFVNARSLRTLKNLSTVRDPIASHCMVAPKGLARHSES
jgi:hypothetical protein